MKKIPGMPATEIEVAEEMITISQVKGYTTHSISIPTVLMHYFWTAVSNEVEKPPKPAYDISTDTYDEGAE